MCMLNLVLGVLNMTLEYDLKGRLSLLFEVFA